MTLKGMGESKPQLKIKLKLILKSNIFVWFFNVLVNY